jgi:hypothetical protein
MDHFKIIRRALATTWRYRALWLFGVLLALTSGGRGNGGGGGGGGNVTLPGPENSFPGVDVAGPPIWLILTIVGVIVVLAFAFAIVSVIVRYLSENALIKMVDEHEETGTKVGIGGGFGLGWSRSAGRFFLIDLVVFLPTVFLLILGLLLGASPLLLWITREQALGVVGTILAIGLILLVVLFFIAVFIVLSLLRHFFLRAAALEGRGVFESIGEGFGLVRRHVVDVVLMGLIMFGIGIAVTLVSIPLILALVILALLAGGAPALLLGGLASLIFEGAVPWIVGAVVGIPLFFLVFGIPALFLSGVYETFKSTTWTLAYRELRAMELGGEGEVVPDDELDPIVSAGPQSDGAHE